LNELLVHFFNSSKNNGDETCVEKKTVSETINTIKKTISNNSSHSGFLFNSDEFCNNKSDIYNHNTDKSKNIASNNSYTDNSNAYYDKSVLSVFSDKLCSMLHVWKNLASSDIHIRNDIKNNNQNNNQNNLAINKFEKSRMINSSSNSNRVNSLAYDSYVNILEINEMKEKGKLEFVSVEDWTKIKLIIEEPKNTLLQNFENKSSQIDHDTETKNYIENNNLLNNLNNKQLNDETHCSIQNQNDELNKIIQQKQQHKSSAIVFCEMKLTAETLYNFFLKLKKNFLNHNTNINNNNNNNAETNIDKNYNEIFSIEPGFITGTDSNLHQQATLQKMKYGEINFLFATNVAEEGLDIKSCQLILNFDDPKVLTSLIQRRGRARSKKLCNDIFHFL